MRDVRLSAGLGRMSLPRRAGNNDAENCANNGSTAETDCKGKRDAEPDADGYCPLAKQEPGPRPAEIATQHERVKGRWDESEQTRPKRARTDDHRATQGGYAVNKALRDHVAEERAAGESNADADCE